MWKKIIPIMLLTLISVSGLSLSFWYNNPTIVELSSGSELLFFSGGNTTKNLQDEKKCKYVYRCLEEGVRKRPKKKKGEFSFLWLMERIL